MNWRKIAYDHPPDPAPWTKLSPAMWRTSTPQGKFAPNGTTAYSFTQDIMDAWFHQRIKIKTRT